jgi:acetyl esterase/lipase
MRQCDAYAENRAKTQVRAQGSLTRTWRRTREFARAVERRSLGNSWLPVLWQWLERRILLSRQNILAALICAAALTQTGCAAQRREQSPPPVAAAGADLMKWPDLLTRPRPAPTASIPYGTDPLQVADLWLPKGGGPHPTVLMVHGGCWQSEIADRTIMNWISNDLQQRGIAVWNIDYRGVDRPGGGYPGTYMDASAAADSLRSNAKRYHLDLSRLTAVGHSAGGHLALWLAGRPRLAASSPLRRAAPLRIRTVVSLGGLPDLEQAAQPPGSGCGTDVIGKISGGRYHDTSVPRLAPLGVRQVLINGLQDRIIPNAYATDYAAAMRARGDAVSVRFVDRTGHVELIAPDSRAWRIAVQEIEKALGR